MLLKQSTVLIKCTKGNLQLCPQLSVRCAAGEVTHWSIGHLEHHICTGLMKHVDSQCRCVHSNRSDMKNQLGNKKGESLTDVKVLRWIRLWLLGNQLACCLVVLFTLQYHAYTTTVSSATSVTTYNIMEYLSKSP